MTNKDRDVFKFYLALTLLPIGILLFQNAELQKLLNQPFAEFLNSTPFFALIVIGLLGKRLNQTRILLISIILFASYYILLNPSSKFFTLIGMDDTALTKMLAICLPLVFSIIIMFKESRLISLGSLFKLTISLSPMIGLFALYKNSPKLYFDYTSFSPITTLNEIPIFIPQLCLVSILIYLLGYFAINDNKISHFSKSIALCLIPFYTAVNTGLSFQIKGIASHNIIVICFLVISAILLHSMYRMYWFRVYIDELTAIPNRRALDEYILSLGKSYYIAMVDIDHFKGFNDKYGHDEGDNVLRMVSSILDRVSKQRAYRYGGEEFTVVYEGVTEEQAFEEAEALREAVEKREFYIRSSSSKKSGNRKSDKKSGILKPLKKKRKKTLKSLVLKR